MKFLDTNYLLDYVDNISDCDERFAISSITLEEIEHIKTSKSKTEEVCYQARLVARWLQENKDKFEVIIYTNEVEELLLSYQLPITPDNKICACAKYFENKNGETEFCTGDLNCSAIAEFIFKLKVNNIIQKNVEDYKGYKEILLDDNSMAYLYEHLNENIYDLNINEYLVIRNKDNQIVDCFRWFGDSYQNVKFPTIKSNLFGTVKPLNGDIYQQMALNSFSFNQLTMIKGAAGTGKSYLALGTMLWMLEKHKIDKIVMFVNPTPTANSAKLGFLPGTQLEKLIDSSVGNMLAGKLGDKYMIEQLVSQNKLSILPMCDIRGFDTSGLNCAVYITEAQNMDISLMKLALQRIGEDSICIIDGDYNAQVDLGQYAGSRNGMRRMSEVFRGQDFYGEIELQNIYRSKIARIAEEM